MSISLQVRMTRNAISPLLAINIFLNTIFQLVNPDENQQESCDA